MSKRNRKNSAIGCWDSAIRNNIAYLHYYQYFKNLAITMFKWENLPPTVDARFLELTLFEKGYGLYFNDDILGNLFLTCTIGGALDVYRIPINRVAYANNGYNNPKTSADSVIVFNNYLHTTPHLDVDMFAIKMYNIDRTIDVNLNAQKTPILILCEEEEKLTMENVYMQYDGNKPVIKGYKSNFDKDAFQVLKTDAPYLVDKLLADKSKIWNEAMTFLGIDNANVEKKERMVTDEVSSNNGQTAMSREMGLISRQQGADKINSMFGTNIKVSFNERAISQAGEIVSRETSEESEVENE